jgi:two-component system response regulator QseB
MRILLVEDDEALGNSICEGLKVREKHMVDWVKDGLTADRVLKREEFDIVILDLGLPKISGYELLQKIRERGITVPVLILTADDRRESIQKLLDAGADDYLTKPFDLGELCSRLRAVQRRATGRAETVISHGDIVLDPAAHTLTYKNKPMVLPRREFALLQKLLENSGHVLSREYLAQILYGWGEEVDSNTVEVFVHNLRKRFGTDFIHTIRGIGYMIDKEEQ